MHSLEEMASWDADDVRAAVLAELPVGWTFVPELVDGWTKARLVDGEGTVMWEDQSADPRLLFFSAYGWLHSRAHKPTNPIWRPRTKEVDLNQVIQGRVGHPNINVPDPPDLDPTEVQAVYADPRFRRR